MSPGDWLVHLGSSGPGSGRGSHRPSVPATSVPLKEWDYNHTGKCSLFVHLVCMCPTLTWHPKLVHFSCLLASQVAHHPASIKPGIGEARTTALWSGVAHTG